MRKVVYLIGPVSVGKSHLLELLSKHTQTGLTVSSMGGEIRSRLLSDPDFGKRFGTSIRDGEPLPEAAIREIFDEVVLHTEGVPVIVDGFPQTSSQVKYAQQRGYLAGSLCLVFNATSKTCLDRFRDKRLRVNGFETEELFRQRLSFHQQAVTGMVHGLMHGGGIVRQIDANREITGELFHDVVSHILAWRDAPMSPKINGAISPKEMRVA